MKNTSPKACSGNAPLKRFPAEKKRQGREKQAKAPASVFITPVLILYREIPSTLRGLILVQVSLCHFVLRC